MTKIKSDVKRYKGTWRRKGRAPRIPNLDNIWRLPIGFTFRQIFLWGGGQSLSEPIEGWVDSRTGLDTLEKINVLSLPKIEPRFLGDPPHSLVTTPAIAVRT